MTILFFVLTSSELWLPPPGTWPFPSRSFYAAEVSFSAFPIDLALPFIGLLLLTGLCYYLPVPLPFRFLTAGLAAGPHGFELAAPPVAWTLIEVAALLLLFAAGRQCTPDRLKKLTKSVPPVLLHAALCTTAGLFIGLAAGLDGTTSLFTGLLLWPGSLLAFSLHSSRQDGSHNNLPDPLVLQCLLVPPALFLLTALIDGSASGKMLLRRFFASIGFLSLTLLLSRNAVPCLLSRTFQRRGRSGLMLTTLTLCLSLALLVHWIGPGVALGAVLAGVLISRSTQAAPALPLLPLMSVLFLALGLLLDLSFFANHPLLITSVLLGVLLLKVLAAKISAALPGLGAAFSGMLLLPIGAPAFLLLFAGWEAGLSPGGWEGSGQQVFFATCILLLLTPLTARLKSRINSWKNRARKDRKTSSPRKSLDPSPQKIHRKTCGFHRPQTAFQSSQTASLLRIVRVEAGAPVAGFSLDQIAHWQQSGVAVLAVWRRNAYFADPPVDLKLQPNDRVLLSVCPERLALSTYLFQMPPSDTH